MGLWRSLLCYERPLRLPPGLLGRPGGAAVARPLFPNWEEGGG